MKTLRKRHNCQALVAVLLFLFSGCAVKQIAVNSVAGILAEGGDGTTFTGEEDPELVRDALPFTLKLHELLLEQTPDRDDLLLATGRLFIMYAHAFIKDEAQYLPDEAIETKLEMLKRAQRLYLRGAGYVQHALDIRHPGFTEKIETARYDVALAKMTPEDVAYLYWCGAGWMGAYSATGFDISLMPLRMKALPLLEKVLGLDEAYESGAVHEFFLAYYGALPATMGGDQEKARYHFRKALDFSNGGKISPYVTLAQTVCVSNQDALEFRDLLNSALSFDTDSSPENRLVNLIARRRAVWLLEHIEDFIIEE